MRTIFVSNEMPLSTRRLMSKYGNVVELPSHSGLPDAISSHPDAIISNIHNKCFALKGYDFIKTYTNDVVFTEETPSVVYPNDTLVNCFCIDNMLFSGKSISRTISEFAENNGMIHITVNQGYTKCSTLVFKQSIITSDPGIKKAAEVKGIKTLLIKPGYIGIKEYKYGFIGGACCTIDNDVVFFGNIKEHPDYSEIVSFLSEEGADIVCDDSYPLFDFGGIFEIDN